MSNEGSIDPQTQKMLNDPVNLGTPLSIENDAFLKKLISMIDEGKIDTLKPDTLINHAVYNLLDELKQGKADIEALNLLSAIRDIYGLYKAGFENSFQMENLVERLRTTKERIEETGGDLFVI